ncbi:YitT family protein [Selenomonas bovis]|uniref:YitT family protein n=1 Tax=Selenomonas bovis TaxID=416586 RepID=UPI0004E1AB21|nr:YitT family protein [Selenomonas bovis]
MFSLVPTGSVARHIVRYAQIVLGALLTSLGYNLFLIPAHLLTGGISGIAIVIYYLTGLPVGAQNFVYNLPILYLAYRVFGRHYAFDTIFGTVVLSVLLDLTHFVVDWNVCANIVLNSVFGGVLTGIGFGMVFRVNANTGGLDVVGAVVKKYYAIDMGTVIFVLNFLIVAGSAFVCTLEEMLFTFISIYVIAELTNRVAAGLNREKSIVIISGAAEKICNDIMENVHRGVTYLDGRGGLTKEPRGILFAVVSLTQVGRVKTIVRHHDPQAFMIVSDTSEVTGKGFTLECESYADAKRKWEEQKARYRAAND